MNNNKGVNVSKFEALRKEIQDSNPPTNTAAFFQKKLQELQALEQDLQALEQEYQQQLEQLEAQQHCLRLLQENPDLLTEIISNYWVYLMREGICIEGLQLERRELFFDLLNDLFYPQLRAC